MSSAYAPPPEQQPELVPANRAVPNKRALWLWLFLIVMFVGFYQFFQDPQHHVEAPPEPRAPTRPWIAWPLVIPGFTLAALTFAFWRIRARLPERFRKWELRIQKRETAAAMPPAEAIPFESIVLKGRSGTHPSVQLRFDEAGLHWSSDAKLLNPAQWLEVQWSELQAFTIAPGASSRSSIVMWFVMIAMGGGVAVATADHANWTAIASVVAVMFVIGGIAFATSRRSAGQLTVVTPTHSLMFSSKELTPEVRERLIAVAKSRRPELFPTQQKRMNPFYALFVQPYVVLGKLLKNDAAVRAEYDAKSPPQNLDEETRSAGIIQFKLYWLWYGGLCAALPLSMAVAFAFITGEAYELFVGYMGAWIAGLIIASRSTNTLGRMTGMTIIQ